MNGLMNGWLDVTKNTDAHERGLEQELDTCLITVSVILVSVIWSCFYIFLSSCTGEKEGLLRKPCRHEDSPVLFCHFFP